MKLGIDVHGVIDKFPFIAELAESLVAYGNEVHIITGASWEPSDNGIFTHEGMEPYLARYGFHRHLNFTHFFSIVDHHKSIGTEIKCDAKGCWLDPDLWNATKSIYCRDNKIDMHLDDSEAYAKLFTTPVALIR